MLKALRLAAAGVLALGVFYACNNTQPGVNTLVLSLSLRQINNQGQQTALTVQATDDKGVAGSGQVNLSANAGFFTATSLTLTNGTATANYSCPAAADARCSGLVNVSATWTTKNNLTQSTGVLVSGAVTGDAGADGGQPDGGGYDAGPSGPLSLTASKNPIFYNVGDFSDVTAQIDGGSGGHSIAFATNLGGFVFPTSDGGTPSPTITGITDSSGKTVVRFRDTGVLGSANISATESSTGSTAGITINITPVQQVSWVSTMCNGSACTIMGIRGSGFNEQSQVTFRVVDSSNHPVPGINVNFSLTNPPSGTTVLPNATTDANGLVTANVSAGPVIGNFTVKATVVAGQLEGQSPNIGLRGAKATNNGFTLNCSPVNISAYAAVNPPAEVTANCDVTLVDRFHNPVGTGTTVNFKSEAGSVPTSVTTIAYPNSGEGTASITFSARGVFPPVDVAPLAANPGQWPFPRSQEPSFNDGALVRNPRDGLVTVIAYLRGEEFYDDNNANGQWDPGERFFDQGEAFVDANDNGVWDPGEFYIDDSPPNGHYDGPNGVYDANTTVWTEARILYTGYWIPDSNHVYFLPPNFSGPCGTGVPKGTFVNLHAYFGDLNLNRVSSQATFQIAHTAGKGSVVMGPGLLDGYGFGIERLWLDYPSLTQCVPTSLSCQSRVLFYDWGSGHVGGAAVYGAPLTDTTPCQPDDVSISTTLLGQTLTLHTYGAIE